MSRSLSRKRVDCTEPGAARSRRRARTAPVASSPTRRAYSPLPVRGCPVHGVLPIGPRPRSIRHPGAVRLPLPGESEVLRAARLPFQAVVSTNAACERRSSLRLLIAWIQNQRHGAGEGVPFRVLGRELLTPERRQAIEPRPLAFLGQVPRRSDPALRLQTMKRRIQRPRLDLEEVFRGALYMLGNRMPVREPDKQGTEDEQVERALQQLNAGRR